MLPLFRLNPETGALVNHLLLCLGEGKSYGDSGGGNDSVILWIGVGWGGRIELALLFSGPVVGGIPQRL